MSVSRRTFLQGAAAGAAALLLPGCAAAPRRRTPLLPDQQLRVAVIGVGNQGHWNLREVAAAGAHVVALCDVDEQYLAKAAGEHPAARTYVDWRTLLRDHDTLDLHAALVATPDHSHAPATAAALRAGLDVYCEKPLTHTVAQARTIADLTRAHGAVTQLGTQIHARANYRRVVELVQSGAIGAVREVHAFCNGKSWSGGDRPAESVTPPASLHWDRWLGAAPVRPFHPRTYHPGSWRRFWDFGGGTLADMGCHLLDLAYWALDLDAPVSVEAEGPPPHTETAPEWLCVRWQYAARGARAPVAVTWYDGTRRPEVLAKLGLEKWTFGMLFVGERGHLVTNYDEHALGPEVRFAGFTPPPPSIPDSVGHHREWVEACRTRGTTSCPFEYAGPLTEAVLLGTVAYRLGQRLVWDTASLRAKNAPGADALLRLPQRAGFEV